MEQTKSKRAAVFTMFINFHGELTSDNVKQKKISVNGLSNKLWVRNRRNAECLARNSVLLGTTMPLGKQSYELYILYDC